MPFINPRIHNSTTTRISSETIGADTYAYTYDVLGNITEIKKNGQTFRRYTYDDLGELIAEEVAGEYRTEYVYDNGGNILSSTKYLYENGAFQSSGETKTYAYSTGAWKDLLTGYDGQSITYDAIGNPTTYLGNALTWSDGRLLSSIAGVASFTYGSGGIRTKKIADGITHEYFLDGSKILCEKRSDGITLHFSYDENGNVFSIEYNGNTYYYVRNILGEIIGLVDTSGNYVVKYTYDAWGNVLQTEDGAGNDVSENSSHIANINPFRYKGYYYDQETELYYLQTRYYDPAIGRFISADHPDCLGANNDFTSFNLFAYCGNNPISNIDETGASFWSFLKDIGKTLVKAAVTVAAVTVAAATVASSIVGTIASGGAGAVAIPAALAFAAECVGAVTVATVTVGATAIAAGEIGENISYSNRYEGGTTYNKNGVRIDYESNGNGTGNVHAHVDGEKARVYTKPEGMVDSISKAASKRLDDIRIKRAIEKAIRIMEELTK